MQKKSLTFGSAVVSILMFTQAHAVENETLMQFNGQANNLPLYTSATGLGTMAVSPPGAGNFSVPADHSAIMTLPGNGITTVFTPSSTAVPTKVTFYDQRTSTYRRISAKCLNSTTQLIEACDLSDVTIFPRTDYPHSPPTYTQSPTYQWFGGTDNYLRVSTPAGGGGQSNGGYITLPPYVREVTVTAFGSGQPDFSGADLYVADAPSVSKAFAPAAVNPGGQSTLTITLKNPGLGAPIPNMNVTDVLPAPLKIVSASHTCTDGTLTAAAGSSTLSLTGATLPTAGCAITAQVEWPGDAAGISACVATPSVSNRITPGDYVDVFMSLQAPSEAGAGRNDNPQARLLLSRLRVLGYGDDDVGKPHPATAASSGDGAAPEPGSRAETIASRSGSSSSSGSNATQARSAILAVPVEDAGRLLLAAHSGKLFLALRNPGDTALADASIFVAPAPVLALRRDLDAATASAAERPENQAYAGIDLQALAGDSPARPAVTANATRAPARSRAPRAAARPGIEIIRGTTPSNRLSSP